VWARELLELALATRRAPPGERARSRRGHVILAGQCRRPVSPDERSLLEAAFEGFSGRIISGGTMAGIAAMVGDLQEAAGADPCRRGEALCTRGYLPKRLPAGQQRDRRYHRLVLTDADDFSPLEAVRYLRDLSESGALPGRVRLLIVGGGGQIATAECQMALALGIPVGIVGPDGGTLANALRTHPWDGHPRLEWLDAKPRALRKFLSPAGSPG